jgi:1-deoxy-D-xylulose-5-phosphate reductoisomerase
VVALANKESLIAGGPLVEAARRKSGGTVLPVDSEHSALWQCLAGTPPGSVARLVLTASGGPFRGRTRAALQGVTVAEALAHPTWQMGPLVTVNSATLVNKGMEVIEAALLFGDQLPGEDPYAHIDVVVHPQSLVHSMVEFVDGSTVAQLSPPDMRIPIARALSWPVPVPGAAPAMDWSRAQTLSFEPLDDEAFPAVSLARRAGRAGGTAPAVYAAAAEAAVAAFLDGNLPFVRIVDVVAEVLDGHEVITSPTLEDVQATLAWARERVRSS